MLCSENLQARLLLVMFKPSGVIVSEPILVSSRAELKQALSQRCGEILITDSKLANQVKVVSYASKAAIAAAVTGAGVATVNAWNPIGWGVAGITAITSGTLISAVAALGIGAVLIWVLWNDYDFSFEGGTEYTDPTGGKHKVYGKASFNKHKKK